jgi:GH24 family phage-related lysozyme (muramidase)
MKIIITETQLKLITESISDDEEFLNYIKDVEGKVIDSKTGLHKAYKDDVGVVTIGYGHSENRDPNIKLGMKIPETKAISYLKSDLKTDESVVNSYVAKKFPGYTLNDKQLKMLVDFNYNPGLSKFPNFVKAVVTKDWETAKKEYKRYAGGKELTDRNQKFYNLFLADKVSQSKTPDKKTQSKPDITLMGTIDYVSKELAKATQPKTKQHIVKSGDTLSGIATKYDTTVTAIKSKNGLKSDKITIGQILNI